MGTRDTGHVVVGITASLAGYQALRYAVAQARARRVPLIAVQTFAPSGPGGGALWREAVREAAARDVADAFNAAMGGVPADVPVSIELSASGPGPGLVEIANQPDDLLVIGGCDAPRIGRWRRAAVAGYCARHAICPVVITPPPSMARNESQHRLARSAADEAERLLQAAGDA
ncbi:MAG TPA: universal stress protein [Micromonosporaceae bacterium]|nr:universal stress protein [Micromonosporaceae bacterium]